MTFREKLEARLAEIKAEVESLRSEMSELGEAEELTEDQESRFSVLTSTEDNPVMALTAEAGQIRARLAILDAADEESRLESGDGPASAPQVMKRTNTDVDIRTASAGEIRSAASARLAVEHKDQIVPVSDAAAAKVERMFGKYDATPEGDVMFDGSALARRFLATETPAYRSAFQKALKGPNPAWTPEENEAINYFRVAEQSLTSASGGYGVPVLIDPSIILTSGAADAPLLGVSRIEPITGSKWKGLSTAGVAFATHSEGAAVSAGQATFAQPEITPETTAAFIPYTVEIGGDFPNFAGAMQSLIEQAYIDFLAAETAVGSAGVIGIFTAIDATSASEVVPTTDGALGPVDAMKVFKALPERHRSRATWFMDVTVESQLRNASAVSGLYTTDMTTEGIGPLLGHRVLLSDYAPDFTGTTGASNLAIVGNFDNYVIVPRVGMSIELIPHVVDADGLPTLRRGWLAWARVGADSVDDNAFRLLQNQ